MMLFHVIFIFSQDINKNRGIAAALAYEEQFFQEHPVFSMFFWSYQITAECFVDPNIFAFLEGI